MPIASDAFGNQVCIGILGKEIGIIFFWDHELEGHPKDACIFMAESFHAFLDCLYEWIDPNESIADEIIRKCDVERLKKLIANGHDIESLEAYGRTIIEKAAIRGQNEIIRFLLSIGAQPRTALQLAERNAEYFPDHRKTVEL